MRLKGKVVVVTGASRGVGRGIAVALGAEGATVYLSGRTMDADNSASDTASDSTSSGEARDGKDVGGSLRQTAAEIDARGGRGVPVRCDHAVDEDMKALFERVESEQGRCDILVNNVFAIPKGEMFGAPFWEQPISFWDTMHNVGLRSHYVASVYAAPMLLKSQGLVANISSFGGASYQVNVAYGVGKAGVDRLARDIARDLKPHGVCSVALYPGVVRTERVLAGELPFSTEVSESPEFTGRAIAALFADPKRMAKTGRVHVVAELAEEYGFDDVDGTRPPSLRQLSQEKNAAKNNAAEKSAKETTR